MKKRQVLQEFLFNHQPDILFLSEMSGNFDSSFSIAALIEDCMRISPGVDHRTNRYTCLARVRNNGVHLMMGIFAKSELFHLRAGLVEMRGWPDGQRRPLLYIECPTTRYIANIFFLHARASAAGGRDAVETILRHVAAHPQDLAGGDFNYSSYIDPAGLLTAGTLAAHRGAQFFSPVIGVHCPAIVPWGGPAPFTQFARNAHGAMALPGTFISFDPGGRIDFMLGGNAHAGRIGAVDSMPARIGGVHPWERAVFSLFDHLPVVYDWNPG
ncbi:MAG: hypothetical protein ACMG6S_29395 [Byssovorax sp.]